MSIVASLKKRKTSPLQMLEQIDKLNSKKTGTRDARLWKPKVGDTGTGSYLVRFLPAVKEGDSAIVQRFDHYINGTGRDFACVCPTTFGLPCPICESNSELWATDGKAEKSLASARKRKNKYFANILIIEDKLTPENQGKVFVYEFGVQIFSKIEGMLKPKYEDQTPVDPFDLFEGASFRVRADNTKKKIGKNKVTEYEESSFIAAGPLLGGDEKKLEEVMKQCHNLSEFDGKKNLLPYEEIQANFLSVTKGKTAVTVAARREDQPTEDHAEDEASAEQTEAEPTSSDDALDEDALLNQLRS